MKRLIFALTLVFCVFMVSACSIQNRRGDALKFKEEYEKLNGVENEATGKITRALDIDEDNPFIYSEASDIIKMIENDETFIVYFGFAECPWCRSILPTLMKLADDTNTEKIYYVNVKDIRDTLSINENGEVYVSKEGTKDYYKLLELLDEVLEDYELTNELGEEVETGEKRIYAPNIVAVSRGVVKEMEDGIVDELSDPFMELTKEIKNEIYDELQDVFEAVYGESVCNTEKGC